MAKRRGCQYPFDMKLVPLDWLQPYLDNPNYAHIDCEAEAEQFRDRNLARGEVYKDWQAAFRMWMRNALKWNPTEATGPYKAPQPTREQLVRERAGQIASDIRLGLRNADGSLKEKFQFMEKPSLKLVGR